MRTILAASILLALALAPAADAADVEAFSKHFEDATLRVDYHHYGDAKTEAAALDAVYKQGTWAGSRTRLVDPFEVGRSVVEVREPGSGALLYSRRFDTYFGEYRTTDPAAKGVVRSYHESALVPYPKAKIKVLVKTRGRDETVATILDTDVDPAAVTINREPLAAGVTVIPVHKGGDPHACVDVAILAEGYTAADRAKLESDLKRFSTLLVGHEPFASAKDKFNVSGVWVPSQDRGCDEPSRGSWRATAFGAAFDALGSERYLLTEDNKALRDAAAHVPYDALYVMVNTARFGGGGIYNLFCTFTSDNQWSPYVFLHEFGHSFAGLADEYYTSSVAYNDMYPKGVEPHEPNITALLDPAKLKWGDLVTPKTPLPTPWEKSTYDARDLAYQKIREELNRKIAAATREGSPSVAIEKLKDEAERLSKENSDATDAYLAKGKFVGKVGAFEGAGYASKGLYRPALDCIMFSKGTKPFCPVCRQAIAGVIEHYGE
jgi:IgA Peptidase M64/Peptidase M64 N-terminus